MQVTYIFKPIFIEFLDLGSTYAIISGSSEPTRIPKFVCTKSEISFFKRKISEVVTLVRTIYQILHVKGIGFKVYYHKVAHSLYFNLGYNHLCKYNLTLTIGVKVRKQYLLIYSATKPELSVSVYQIRALRLPDPYRGKGIRFRFQQLKFKPGKQR
jgi:ribosomal protein L6P/L9E